MDTDEIQFSFIPVCGTAKAFFMPLCGTAKAFFLEKGIGEIFSKKGVCTFHFYNGGHNTLRCFVANRLVAQDTRKFQKITKT